MGTLLSLVFPHIQESAPLLPFNPLSPQVRLRKKKLRKSNSRSVGLLPHPFGARTESAVTWTTWVSSPLCSSFRPRWPVGQTLRWEEQGHREEASTRLRMLERGQNLAEHRATRGDSGKSAWVTTAGVTVRQCVRVKQKVASDSVWSQDR